MELAQICEDAVTYSVLHKGYKDHTSNLKTSISYSLFYNGELMSQNIGKLAKPDKSNNGQQGVVSAMEEYCAQPGVVKAQGYSLVIVAGMEYANYVEKKGYNVLYLTKSYTRKQITTLIRNIIDDLRA